MSLTLTDDGGISVTVTGPVPEEARSKAWDSGFVSSRLTKLGGTIYEPVSCDCDIDEGLAGSAAVLGEVRRAAVEALDRERAGLAAKTFAPVCELHEVRPVPSPEGRTIRIKIRKASQLEGLETDGIEFVCVLPELCERAAQLIPVDRIAVTMPRFTFDESAVDAQLEAIKKLGIVHMLGENIGHFHLAKKHGFILHTDFTLNIANSYALEQAADLGAMDCIISPELTAAQIGGITKAAPVGIYAYGRLPLMLTVNCPVRSSVGCKGCTGGLTDRTKRRMPVRCSKNKDYAEIFNSDVLWIADRISQFSNADFFLLDFLDETADEINAVTADYLKALRGKRPASKPQNATFGLYSRGLV